METNRRFSVARAARSFQDSIVQAGPAAAVSYGLIGAIMLFGGVGFFVDRWLDSSPWALLTGLALGLVVGFYELARAAFRR